MHLEYEISEQDFLNGQRLAIKNSPVRSIRWTRLALPLFGIVLLAFWIQSVLAYGLSVRAMTGLIFPIFFVSLPLLTRWNQKKMYAKATSLHGKMRLDLEEEGLTFAGPTCRGRTEWSNFSRFFEDEKCFVLYQTTQIFNIIPKRYISANQIPELRQYLIRKLSSTKP